MNNMLLFFGLFFPRISLFVAWFVGVIPPNIVPLWFEVFLTAFLPRGLICFYIGTTLGWDSGWLVAHVVAWFLAVALSVLKTT